MLHLFRVLPVLEAQYGVIGETDLVISPSENPSLVRKGLARTALD
jgi:hypothetical protein